FTYSEFDMKNNRASRKIRLGKEMSDRRSGGRGRDDRRDDKSSLRTMGNDRERYSSGSYANGDRNRREPSPRHGSGSFGVAPTRNAQMSGRGRDMNGQAFTESELMTDLPKKKFTGRCRLFVGNLPNEVKEQELKEMFSPHGDIAECYLSGKGFAFLRLDTRAHAESAKEAIDGRIIHGRPVRVRFAVHGAALRVKELSPTVSNEMLYHAFAHFGEVERAVHIVDEKGRPTGEGIVEFERKPSANEAISAIKDRVFLLTSGPKPLVVEVLEPRDEDDGLAERMISRTPQLQKERELGPRFPQPNTFEFVYGMKWKELYENERRRREGLESELKEERKRLEADMELAYQDYQAQMLREDLQRRQQELERLEAARRARMNGMGGPPSGMPPGPFSSGMSSAPSSDFGANMYGAPPPNNAMNPMAFGGMSGPPPQMGGPPQGGGNYGAPPQAGPRGGGNVMEGVQRLLQIFKSDDRPGGGMGPPQSSFGAFGGGSPAFGMNPSGGAMPFGRPPNGPNDAFGQRPNDQMRPNDYPPEKRRR
ncbi:hypothetical protein PENTCL1PPCAC_11528, partial [Pristionchus entomophagus]